MFQLAVLPGRRAPKNLDSFLKPIVDEFKDLSNHGLLIKRNGEFVCSARINLVIASGDIPAAASLSHHTGHMSKNGCRLCRITVKRVGNHNCFLEMDATLRDKTDFINDTSSFVSKDKKNTHCTEH